MPPSSAALSRNDPELISAAFDRAEKLNPRKESDGAAAQLAV